MAHALHLKKGALQGHGKVYCMDAAHRLHNAVPDRGWIKRRMTIERKTTSGRNRHNLFGAYSPDDHTLEAIAGTESCDAELVAAVADGIIVGSALLDIIEQAAEQGTDVVRTFVAGLRAGVDQVGSSSRQ